MQIAFAFFLRRSRSLLNLIFTVKVASAPADNVNVIAIWRGVLKVLKTVQLILW